MSNNINFDQRLTYKFVENFNSGKIKNPEKMLKSFIRDLVNHEELNIIGGRIWEMVPSSEAYRLMYQFGKVKHIPSGYTLPVEEYDNVYTALMKNRTVLAVETDELLRESGIELYSVTGVGDILRLKSGKYYKYLLGFNAKELPRSFSDTLNVISSVITVALRNASNQDAQQKIKKDINKASEIQRSLLPDHFRRFQDFDIYGICIPDSAVGGDYFDYLSYPDEENERLGIVISDAASKGLPAAIQALFVSGAMKMGIEYNASISQLIGRLNNLIYEAFPYERLVTMFFIALTNSENRLALYANAGHCSPFLYHPDIDQFRELKSTGGLLGVAKKQKYGVENIRMRHGSILVLYTDGITEANNALGEMFGEDRLKDLIRKFRNEKANIIALSIIEEVQKFSAESLYNDDKTIIVIKRDVPEQIEEKV
ncbi:MAG: PP2C family protein-serine/threonine phosphatase [Candidatus Kapabacteria bacterium]|nr:PP2C family protein-serine/threonine phosphatase [Candidatus Kapabacteria bacterium]